MAAKHRYQSLSEDFGDLDNIDGVTTMVRDGDDGQHGNT
jgi:hypothetical protein